MTPGELVALYVILVGVLMWALGRWHGRAALIRAAWAVQDEIEAQAAEAAEAPLIAPADLTLAAAVPGPVRALAYVPDKARVQLVPGLYQEGDFEEQYQATWSYSGERARWAGHIIEGIWRGIKK